MLALVAKSPKDLIANLSLERNLLIFGDELGRSVGHEMSKIVQHSVNVSTGGTDRDRDTDLDDRFPGRGKRTSQSQGPRQLRGGTSHATEHQGGLCSNASELDIILHACGVCGAEIPDGVRAEFISRERFAVDRQSQRKFSLCMGVNPAVSVRSKGRLAFENLIKLL